MNFIVEHESAGPSDAMSQPNTSPNLNLAIYAIEFQFCILTSSTDRGSSWDTRKMYLEIEYIGKKLGSLRGREGETMEAGRHCHCETLKTIMFRKRSYGGCHQAEKLGKSQRMMNCGMHCSDTFSMGCCLC